MSDVRPSGVRRGVAALALGLVAGAASCALVAPAQAAGAGVPETQALVMLLQDRVARSAPNARAQRIETVSARRPLTRVRTVLPVLGVAVSDGAPWLYVRLPGRPSGHKGWIPASRNIRMQTTEWHIVIRLAARQVVVYRGGRVERRFRAAVGTRSTPTPQGRFFIEEALAISPADSGGPFALATSARSNVLQEFNGGPGQIALHGTDGLAGALGSAVSHGCIRLGTGAITWLARRIGSGVPLTIRR